MYHYIIKKYEHICIFYKFSIKLFSISALGHELQIERRLVLLDITFVIYKDTNGGSTLYSPLNYERLVYPYVGLLHFRENYVP